jgi:hypothetical protein
MPLKNYGVLKGKAIEVRPKHPVLPIGRPQRAAPTIEQSLFLELCVPEKPHRLVFEIPVQPELVHEMWIECKAARQHELQKPALAQSKNALTCYLRPAEHNDLSISRPIRVWHTRNNAEERM